MPIDGNRTRPAADRRARGAALAESAPSIRDSVRRGTAEQIAPIVSLQGDLEARWPLALDVTRCHARMMAGQVAYDPLEVIGSAGNLLVAFVRATVAIERAGLMSEDEAIQARERRFQLMSLIAGWLSGEPMPRERVRSAARRAASLVASSILRRASRDLQAAGVIPRDWPRPVCPCCGGAPDFAFTSANDRRTLLCARCDARWETTARGCLGCGETEAPMLARIASPALGYALMICNPCGRYIKEPLDPSDLDPALDRVLTQQLDAAAEARGLRL